MRHKHFSEKGVYLYISEELLVPENAAGQVNRIRNAVRKLDSMPSRHPLVEWEPWHSMNMLITGSSRFVTASCSFLKRIVTP